MVAGPPIGGPTAGCSPASSVRLVRGMVTLAMGLAHANSGHAADAPSGFSSGRERRHGSTTILGHRRDLARAGREAARSASVPACSTWALPAGLRTSRTTSPTSTSTSSSPRSRPGGPSTTCLRSSAAPRARSRRFHFQQEVFRDLRVSQVRRAVDDFTELMRGTRRLQTRANRSHYRYQRERWWLDAGATYCRAVEGLTHSLAAADLRSCGLTAICVALVAKLFPDDFAALNRNCAEHQRPAPDERRRRPRDAEVDGAVQRVLCRHPTSVKDPSSPARSSGRCWSPVSAWSSSSTFYQLARGGAGRTATGRSSSGPNGRRTGRGPTCSSRGSHSHQRRTGPLRAGLRCVTDGRGIVRLRHRPQPGHQPT